MSVIVKRIQSTDMHAWDTYVHNHPHATLYHLSGWKNVIEKTYGHKTYYLIAVNDNQKLTTRNSQQENAYGLSAIRKDPSNSTNPKNPINLTNSTNRGNPSNSIIGILPLVHLKHFLFGNSLISMPFFDMGGILADDQETEKALLTEAIQLGQKLKVKIIELRHIHPLSWLRELNPPNPTNPSNPNNHGNPSNPSNPITVVTKSNKVRMLLDFPESSETLMKSFKAKLRSQIRKPIKEGLNSKMGGEELSDDFYRVFSINMRDLGSPVHSKLLIQNVLREFPEKTRIVMVYKDDQPLACSVVVGFKNTLENPWASALREYSRLGANMLLYWTMLEYACDNNFIYFDFGRSSPNEGTYKFKEQWGAKQEPLHWQYISLNGKAIDVKSSEKSRFDRLIYFWQKLPVPLTKIIGPVIRKHIGL